MARHRHDPYYVPATEEERRLDRHLSNAFKFERIETETGGKVAFAYERAMHDVFDCIVRMGDRGCTLAASLFADRVKGVECGRGVRSTLLTRYARVLYDTSDEPGRPVRESEIAHVGRFIGAIIGEMPGVFIEWAEDMSTGCATCGLEPQPTAVIRGAFLSPALDQGSAEMFWKLSDASKRFPVRIFSDPCGPDEGALFSPWHHRAFASVYSHAPDSVVERFVKQMIACAVWKTTYRFDEARRERYVAKVRAEESLRRGVFMAIAGGVVPPDRREYVSRLYGLAA